MRMKSRVYCLILPSRKKSRNKSKVSQERIKRKIIIHHAELSSPFPPRVFVKDSIKLGGIMTPRSLSSCTNCSFSARSLSMKLADLVKTATSVRLSAGVKSGTSSTIRSNAKRMASRRFFSDAICRD